MAPFYSAKRVEDYMRRHFGGFPLKWAVRSAAFFDKNGIFLSKNSIKTAL